MTSPTDGPAWSLDGVPERPGVYLFRDAAGEVLYVGKALDLKKRLASYRRPGGDGRLAVQFLERDAVAVETVVTRTEQEALLLEDTLIKQHKPPHNIRLKDDKSFLMIRLDLDERFPRLKFVRQHSPRHGKGKGAGRSRLFGPYASARSVRRTMSDLHRLVPLRDCSDAVLNNRSRPCLKHQIGLCSAPCVDLIDEAEYARLVERASAVLSGDTAELERDLRERMEVASEELEYERAAHWRDRLKALRRTVERQGVTPRDKVERDVLGLAREGANALVHRIAFRDGRMAESRSHFFRSSLPDEELVHVVLTALYAPGRREVPREVLLPCPPEDEELLEHVLGDGVRLVVPTRGETKRMLDLAGENARAELEHRQATSESDREALRGLARLTGLDEPGPEVMDCFDVSNFQGTNVVASRVRFQGGRPDRSGYRRFKVRGVEGQDDFASMREVVYRSLKRGLGRRRPTRPGRDRRRRGAAHEGARGARRGRRLGRADRRALEGALRAQGQGASGRGDRGAPGRRARPPADRAPAPRLGAPPARAHPRRGAPLRDPVPPQVARPDQVEARLDPRCRRRAAQGAPAHLRLGRRRRSGQRRGDRRRAQHRHGARQGDPRAPGERGRADTRAALGAPALAVSTRCQSCNSIPFISVSSIPCGGRVQPETLRAHREAGEAWCSRDG